MFLCIFLEGMGLNVVYVDVYVWIKVGIVIVRRRRVRRSERRSNRARV